MKKAEAKERPVMDSAYSYFKKNRRKTGVMSSSLLGYEHEESSWILSMSDLMSLLLIFFLVWTTVKINQLETERKSGSNIYEKASENGNPDNLGFRGILMDFDPIESQGNIMVVLDGEILFASGSSKITHEGKMLLKKIAGLLMKNPKFNLRVIGHTDNTPLKKDAPWESNIELSLARGAAVASTVISFGIPPERVVVQGEGDRYPVKDNEFDNFKALNRRVELIIEPY